MPVNSLVSHSGARHAKCTCRSFANSPPCPWGGPSIDILHDDARLHDFGHVLLVPQTARLTKHAIPPEQNATELLDALPYRLFLLPKVFSFLFRGLLYVLKNTRQSG